MMTDRRRIRRLRLPFERVKAGVMFKIIVPDRQGSRGDSWQANWLRTDGEAVLAEPMPGGDLAGWREKLAVLAATYAGAVVIARGLGASLCLDLARRGPDGALAGMVLINPREFTPAAREAGFGLPDLPIERPTIVIHDREDAGMAIERTRACANMWEALFIDLTQLQLEASHRPGAAPDWPLGEELLARFRQLNRSQAANGQGRSGRSRLRHGAAA